MFPTQTSVLNSGWPKAEQPDFVMQASPQSLNWYEPHPPGYDCSPASCLQRAAQYIEDLIPTMRKLIQKSETPIKKKGAQQQVGGSLCAKDIASSMTVFLGIDYDDDNIDSS